MNIVKIRIDFYDTEQRKLIRKNYPTDFEILKNFEGKTIEVPLEDFKTYAFFRHQYTKSDGTSATFIDLQEFAQNWGHYNLYFKPLDNGALVSTSQKLQTISKSLRETTVLTEGKSWDRIPTDVSEMLGVAGGLSVASIIYGFIQADWQKIPETNKHKDFDYSIASCLPGRCINIEAKGSVVENNSLKPVSVSKHKRDITDKKADAGFTSKYGTTRDICIGIITVADAQRNLQAWLVDPPVDELQMPPEKAKLLKRLYFYYSILRLISKRSYLTLTLANRIKAIEQISDYASLNGVPLLDYDMKKIRITTHFVVAHSSDSTNQAIGKAFIIDETVHFIGLHRKTIKTIIDQDFNKILNLRESPSTEVRSLNCKIDRQKDDAFISPNNPNIQLIFEQKAEARHIYLAMKSDMIMNSAGICVAREPLMSPDSQLTMSF